MPSGIRAINPTPKNPEGSGFEAVYEAPFGGVNSSLYPTDIPANDFVQCDNLIIQNGVLVTVSPNTPVRQTGTLVFILDPTTAPAGAYIIYVFNCANFLCALDQFGNVYTYQNKSNVYSFVLDFINPTYVGGQTVPYGNRPVQVINNLAYIPVANTTTGDVNILIYNPTIGYTTPTSGYSAGLHLNVLSGYLIQLNVLQTSDDPKVEPSRFSWSGSYNYTEFNPATDRTAGYNTLTDSATEIVGMFSMSNVGYIIRTEGITQASPTGISLQPFNFTTLWTSKFGVGSQYSSTIAQFGNFGFFVSESDIYVFNGAAPQGITQTAKAAIYNDIQSSGLTTNSGIDTASPYLSGDVSSYFYYPPTPAVFATGYQAQANIYYILAFAVGDRTLGVSENTNEIIIWMYSADTARWTRTIISLQQILDSISLNTGDTVTSCLGKTEVITVNYAESLPAVIPTFPTWVANTWYSSSNCILEETSDIYTIEQAGSALGLAFFITNIPLSSTPPAIGVGDKITLYGNAYTIMNQSGYTAIEVYPAIDTGTWGIKASFPPGPGIPTGIGTGGIAYKDDS